jgi:hypothetical protein
MNLSHRIKWGIGSMLAFLVAATQGHHFGTSLVLPPAAWAAFFMGGLYLGQWRFFAIGLCLVGALDFAAVTWGGVSDACITPAYFFMVPAYGVLWLAGRRMSRHSQPILRNLPFFLLSLSSIGAAEFIASGSYYWISQPAGAASLNGLAVYLVTWFPQTLQAFAFWMLPAAWVHLMVQKRYFRLAEKLMPGEG